AGAQVQAPVSGGKRGDPGGIVDVRDLDWRVAHILQVVGIGDLDTYQALEGARVREARGGAGRVVERTIPIQVPIIADDRGGTGGGATVEDDGRTLGNLVWATGIGAGCLVEHDRVLL